MAEIPPEVLGLIERFEAQSDLYMSPTYNEAKLRVDFINPMFKALGWDIDNSKGYSEAFRSVLHEDALRVQGTVKSPDLAFRIGSERKFFVEAKKPSVMIKDDVEPAYQLRRYAWTAKLPLSILTSFAEFAVYDCRVKPKFLDKAATARLWYFTYKDYPQRWEEIASIFSQDGILRGGYDRFVKSQKKSGTQDFDDAFLGEMEEWRKELAVNLALRNTSLDESGLNFSTQRIIDRIIFLRICEDRGVEPPFQLQALLSGDKTYDRLQTLFRKADQRYNSGLFHFRKEKDRHESPDELTPGLDMDDSALKHIIKRLYYPDSPYVFKEVSAAILGNIYERFLGNVIHLTAGHRAKVEAKPEVRKAGGVFYTPKYIVDYIVHMTLGPLLKGKTPSEAATLRILDPACGSGSFLLGAYQFLLDWHEQWYLSDDPSRWLKIRNPTLRPGPKGRYVLTIRERKRILANNLYGVDLDPQAVEVTKLSLLLKCLEGESQESIDHLLLFHERALPDLGDNIKCGNSLISTNIFEGDEWKKLSPEQQLALRPFNWRTEFPATKTTGGFDAVIGNPPYVRMEEFKPIKRYLRANYVSHDERSDLYAYFVEGAHKLLRNAGGFGMIVSNKFLRGNYGAPLREFLRENVNVKLVVDFAGLPVFKGATVRTIILLTSNEPQESLGVRYSPPLPEQQFATVRSGSRTIEEAISDCVLTLPPSALTRDPWAFAPEARADLLRRLRESGACQSLRHYCEGRICRGIVSGLTDAFVIDSHTRNAILRQNRAAGAIIKPLVQGREIRRYLLAPSGQYLIYTYHGIDIHKYPAVEAHLRPFKDRLLNRATKQEWFELQQPQLRFVPHLDGPKIIFPDIAISPRFALDVDGHYGSNTTYFIPGRNLFLLAVLNSKLAYLYFKTVCAGLEGKGETYLRFFGQYLEGFPVPVLDLSSKRTKSPHDRLVSRADQILALHKSLAAAQSPTDKESLQRQIDATDRQIDRLVYDLYGLTEDEVKTVEESTAQ